MANLPSRTPNSHLVHTTRSAGIIPSDQTTSTPSSLQQARITRSAARLAAKSSASINPSKSSHSTSQPETPFKKRKAGSAQDSSPVEPKQDSTTSPSTRKIKKQKIKHFSEEEQAFSPQAVRSNRRNGYVVDTAMSNDGSSSKYTDESYKQLPAKPSSKRASSRNNKSLQQDFSPSTQPLPTRRQKRRPSKKELDGTMKTGDDSKTKYSKRDKATTPPLPPQHQSSDSDDGDPRTNVEDDTSDPFSNALFGTGGRGPGSGLSNTLRALSGMMSGMSSRLRDILNNLRQFDNPTLQLVALEELSNLLLVSNEDNLSGQFSPDPYVKELVALMQANPITGEENPEMMLLACRCIANLMEALRGSVANVVYGGAVPVLCQKLLDIQYIDVAEQALSTLSKVSIDFPASIVREGGLTACLQFLDFFATGTQRTAVTTAANCCRNIPHDSFPVIRDVMPILQNVLVSHDQKVVEQGSLCVTRVIDSFKHSKTKIEQLVDPGLLKAILGLLLPGTTNLIGANIHTEFLRVLAIVARASPKLSTELLKMNIVDTLYQILTGVSPPDEISAASKIESVVVMQALIHRPREQVYETLNVICQLLPQPKLSSEADFEIYNGMDDSLSERSTRQTFSVSNTEKRLKLLEQCKRETRKFATILLPTLTDAYSSTVNLSVRQKVLTAQLKVLSNLEVTVIEDALRPVPYASFLASILSQEDHPSLVMFALQASELLFERLEDIYQYQFHREGVIGEIKRLAERPMEKKRKSSSSTDSSPGRKARDSQNSGKRSGSNSENSPTLNEKEIEDHTTDAIEDVVEDEDDDDDDEDEEENDDDDDEDDEAGEDHQDEDQDDEDEIIIRNDHDLDESPSSNSSDEEIPPQVAIAGISDLIIIRAKKFLEKYETSKGREMKAKAAKIRDDLRELANEIEASYSQKKTKEDGKSLFMRLARYFDGDALESITSSELLESGIIKVLADVLTRPVSSTSKNPPADFLSAFMVSVNPGKTKSVLTPSTSNAFNVLIQKLQDLLSRAEHFEVLTVNNNASESSRSNSTSMLSRQLRLRLVADDDGDIPQSYREMIVSIHAIATFKALDDYLRPRFTLSERPSSNNRRREMLQQMANARMAHFTGAAESGLFTPFGQELGGSSPPGSYTNPRATTRLSSRTKSNLRDRQIRDGDKTTGENVERRRSSRRNQTPSTTAQPQSLSEQENAHKTPPKLECADEKVIEDTDGPLGDGETLETFVEGVDEDVSDEDAPEPGAVSMEVASTGKVTARQEDGTRVLTPQSGTPVPGAVRSTSNLQTSGLSLPVSNLPTTGRPSYAAALAAVPQDWHTEFSIDDKTIPNSTTIYRAVHHNREIPQNPTSRSVWSGVHTVKFRKVKGPPPDQTTLTMEDQNLEQQAENTLPVSLNGHPITSSILALLQILHELNAGLDDLREPLGRAGLEFHAEPLASFINTKLTAKLNRQLEEPLIVASHCLPDWSEDLAKTFPFLFPFETRHLFLQSTSFGYSRSITRWQNTQSESDERRDRRRDDRPMMGRPQRQKVRISRNRILESAMKVMEMYGASPSILEVEYFEEVGTGLGPTLEFYATVSKEFSKKKLKMWRENDSTDNSHFAYGKNGLFPAPMNEAEVQLESGKKFLHFFKMLGKFVARSMLDARIIDISFNPIFFKLGGSKTITPSIAILRSIDHDLANSLAQLQQYANAKQNIMEDVNMNASQKSRALQDLTVRGATIEDLMLDFTLPGYPTIELVDGGSNKTVNITNVELYIERVLECSLGNGVKNQVEAFQTGFSQVFSYSSLRVFTPNELVMLFGRVDEDWSIETLMDSVKADHGFNMDSKSVKNLLQVMSELTPVQRRDFLQFVTGSPKLPIGGFKSLTPMFTVVCKPSEPPYSSDDYLPSVMTCVNYLKLSDYSNQDTLKARLNVAIREGQGAFHLS